MALMNIMIDEHNIVNCWEGKYLDCTYWIGERNTGKFTVFGADSSGWLYIEAKGNFDSYKDAREYIKVVISFKGRMRKVL